MITTEQESALRLENHRLRTALGHAREKLALYRQVHSGEYVGGVEYTALMREIDAALA